MIAIRHLSVPGTKKKSLAENLLCSKSDGASSLGKRLSGRNLVKFGLRDPYLISYLDKKNIKSFVCLLNVKIFPTQNGVSQFVRSIRQVEHFSEVISSADSGILIFLAYMVHQIFSDCPKILYP